jgi:SNF2 family DNA or RNA helicase
MSKTKRNKFIEAMKETKPTTMDIFVVNLESLVASKDAETAAKEFFKYHTKPMGIIDESTCIKTPRSKGTRKILAMSPKFNVRRIITGSPITNSPFDMFAQSQFLEKNCLGFQTYNRFKEYYAVFKPIRLANGRTINVPERFVNLDDLAKRLEPMSYRVLKKDCLDLPPKIYETRSVDLTPIQRKIYNDILANKFTEFEGKEMTADIVLTTLLRQHQIICGSYTADDGTIIRIPECPRIYQLMDLLEETSGKVIIFANYVDNIKQICEYIEAKYGKESYVHYYGDTTTAERTDAIRLFEDPLSPVRFFVGNTQTAGRGITLVQAETVIYYSNNYSLESRQQSEDRAHRPGQTKSVTYVDMLCRDTIDEKIIKALMSKQSISQQILQDDPKEWFKL